MQHRERLCILSTHSHTDCTDCLQRVCSLWRRGCSEDDWLCRVCSRGQVSYLHLLAQKMLRSAPFGRSVCSPNTRTALCFPFVHLSLLFSPHFSSSAPFFLLFKNSLQSKKNTKIPARFPWYIICLHDILFFSCFQQKSTLFCWIGVKNDKMAKEDYFYLITVLLL